MSKETVFQDFETYVKSGGYKELKQSDLFLKEAKAHLRKELEQLPGKRHEYRSLNMVAKFVAKKIQRTDHSSIIEEMLNYLKPEVALSLITLDVKQIKQDNQLNQIAAYQEEATYYVRPYLNKAGKSYVPLRESLFGGQSNEQLIGEIKMAANAQALHKQKYTELKNRLTETTELQKIKKKKLSIGSLSLIQNTPTWDLQGIFTELGDEFISSYGKVDLARAEEWSLMGRIPQSIIKKHREIVDIQLDFIVMQLDVEEKVMQYHNNRRSQLSSRQYG